MAKMSAEQKFQYWADHVKAWKASGLSQVGYCKQSSISYDQFNYQYNRFHKSQPAVAQTEAPNKDSDFITVSVEPACSKPAPVTQFKVQQANGAIFEWSAPWSPEDVASFIAHWGN
jgi:hypothetical protein